MKKKLGVLVLLAVVIMAASPAYSYREIQIMNETGWPWYEIWVGPSSNTKWLDRDRCFRGYTLRSGMITTLQLGSAGRENVRYWDIRIDYYNGKRKEFHDIDMYSGFDLIVVNRYWRMEFQR